MMSGPDSTLQQSYPSSKPPFQPNEEQIARATALQRFNRLYIYLPIGLVAGLVIILSLLLLYLAIFPPSDNTWLFLSGLADFILVMWMLPMVIIMGLLLAAGIGGAIYYKYFLDDAQKPLPPAPPYGRLRTLLWRIDTLLIQLLPKLRAGESKIAQPIIRVNAWFVYLETWLHHLQSLILRR
jgi:hypothetical protein